MPADLVLVSLGGVQRLVIESGTTADATGGSDIVVSLARRIVEGPITNEIMEATWPRTPRTRQLLT